MAYPAHAQDAYPSKAIRIIVPTAPGGPSDHGSRLIAEELNKRWGKPVVVETRPGAGTIVGSEMVAKAPPDGYTLLMSPSTLATNPASYKKMPYKGSLPSLVDLVAGRVALTATSSLANILPHVHAGRLRPLGVTSSKRL